MSRPSALVTIDGVSVSEADVQLQFLIRQIPAAWQPPLRQPLLQELVDRRLIGAFLASRKVVADPEALDAQVRRVTALIAGEPADEATSPASAEIAARATETLARIGCTPEMLRRELALPLAWRVHVNRIVTEPQIRDYFARHRSELDGSEVRASQIVISLAPESSAADWRAAEQKLQAVRDDIVAKRASFIEAARKYSTSPSGQNGGDLGFFPFRGALPRSVSETAFTLPVGAVSAPVRSPYGVHLITVTERKPGDLSLEDVRPEILAGLARELWEEQVRNERARADIRWASPATAP